MKVLRILDDKLEEYFLVTVLAAMCTLVFVQVIMRYVFGSALFWSEELARYMFLWLIWIGAAYATKKRSHIVITFFVNKLSGTPRKIINAIVILAWIGFATFLTLVGWQLTTLILNMGQLSPAMRIPIGFVYASVPVGCGLMVIRLIQNVIKDQLELRRNKKEVRDQ